MVIKLNQEYKKRENPSEKRKKLNEDIREIIDKNIKVSEIKDFPFPMKHTASIRENINTSINYVERDIANENNILWLKVRLHDCLSFSINKEGNGYKIIMYFNKQAFEDMLCEGKKETDRWIRLVVGERIETIRKSIEEEADVLDEIIGEAETAFQVAEQNFFTSRNKTVGVYLSKEDIEALNIISEFLKMLQRRRE